ncbi:hypothetical protein Tco_1349008 [Tanacetum coccineum]
MAMRVGIFCFVDLIVLLLYLTIFFYYVAEMDLFAFIRHSDPTKVVVGERNVTDGEAKLFVSNEGRTVPLVLPASAALGGSSDSIDKLFDEGDDAEQEHSIERDDDALEETIAKDVSEVVVEKAKKKRKRKVTEDASGSTYPPKKLRDDYQSVPSNTGGKSLAAIRSYSEANSFTRYPVANASVVTVAVTTIIVADVAAVPVPRVRVELKNLENFRDSTYAGRANANAASISKWKVINDSILENLYVCRNLTNRLASPALFTQLRAMDYDQLYSKFNVGAARQVCLRAEVRMRVEHTLEKKGELEDKCAEQVALLSEKGAKIANLKSLLSLKEEKAAEAIRLRGQLSIVTTLESVTTVKEAELASLSAQVAKLTFDLSSFRLSRDELSSKVASLEFEMDSLANQRSSLESAFEHFKEQMEVMQDEQATVLGNRVAELDAQLLEMAAHLEEEFYTRFLTTVSGLRWILTHGLKLVLLKCLQSFEYLCTLGETINCEINKGM